MKDISVDDILNRIDSLQHGKEWLIDKLRESVISLRSHGFDKEEILAWIEGAQHEMPQNIPLFKLWASRTWEELEKKSFEQQDKE